MPAVTAQAGRFGDGQPGYGDALRSLICGVVARTQEATGLGLRIELDTGSAVLHPPAGDLAGPEIPLLPGFEDRQMGVLASRRGILRRPRPNHEL
jgi:hypothetical protein